MSAKGTSSKLVPSASSTKPTRGVAAWFDWSVWLRVVVKIGSSSLTKPDGSIDEGLIAKICAEVADVVELGDSVVLVSSGAIAAGLGPLGLASNRPNDLPTLQAIASVGQPRLMRAYEDCFAKRDLVCGQVLLIPGDFADRRQYLHARQTIERLLAIGVVPVVNENDATADDELRFGDNDRLAALVAHMIDAELLVLLTDTAGLHTGDPRLVGHASLIEEVTEIDQELERAAGGPGSTVGSGGMASKLSAAKIASWSGVKVIIAAAKRPSVISDSMAGVPGVGTAVLPHDRSLSARKLWLAFAVSPSGNVVVDKGARKALVEDGRSLLAAGVMGCEGAFQADDIVEVIDEDGVVIAKGVARVSRISLEKIMGKRTSEISDELPQEVVHRDDLVVLA